MERCYLERDLDNRTEAIHGRALGNTPYQHRECVMSHEALSARTLRLQRKRDNIIYVLAHEELSDEHTLRLETQLSSVEDELVFLRMEEAA